KTRAISDAEKEAEAPSAFAKQFLYSIDGEILEKEERESLVDNMDYSAIDMLFQRWQGLQNRFNDTEDNLQIYCKSFASRMKYKLCRFFQTVPNDPIVRDMDPITRSWFYF